ncbi:hypothetical protein [Nocardioides speluncae]|uniref:hypothetical protein n=1 Tax=Nocardioides speluncae TaxID=2670337 RepID=UPI0012B16844|nr:hypothetical protein [Nocardioides speluncae]
MMRNLLTFALDMVTPDKPLPGEPHVDSAAEPTAEQPAAPVLTPAQVAAAALERQIEKSEAIWDAAVARRERLGDYDFTRWELHQNASDES